MSKKRQNVAVAKGDATPAAPKKSNTKTGRSVLKLVVPIAMVLLAAYYCGNAAQEEEGEELSKRPEVLLNYANFRVQFPRLKAMSLIEETRRHLLFTVDLATVGLHNMGYVTSQHTYMMGQSPFKSDRTIVEQNDILGQLEEFNLTQIMLNLNSMDSDPMTVPMERSPLDVPVAHPPQYRGALREKEDKPVRPRGHRSGRSVPDFAGNPAPVDYVGEPSQYSSPLPERSSARLADLPSDGDTQKRDPLDLPVSKPLFGGAAARDDKPRKSRLRTANKVSQWVTRSIQGDAHFEIPNYPLDAQPDPNSITHIDADLRHCSRDIHDQSHCGACYAFSWNSFAEWHYCKQSGRQIDFSEQHMIDCGHLAAPGLYGCREGYLPDAKQFTQKFGFHLESDYPYKGKQASSCTRATGTISAKVVEFTRVQVDRDQWEEILREQPIVVQVHLPKDVMSYQQGIHPGTNCDKTMGHGMLLLGHGRDEANPYWLLKNSMGSNWGENGYLRLSRDAPMAQCFGTGFVAKFKFESLDQDAYLDFYDNLKFQPSEHEISKPALNKGAIDWLRGHQ